MFGIKLYKIPLQVGWILNIKRYQVNQNESPPNVKYQRPKVITIKTIKQIWAGGIKKLSHLSYSKSCLICRIQKAVSFVIFKKLSHLLYSKSCLICHMMCVLTIYLCKRSIKPVLANILKQSIQSCTPLVNNSFLRAFIAV